jgi:folate-dependent phosphoribosylglycinamide formyltransferase PurN
VGGAAGAGRDRVPAERHRVVLLGDHSAETSAVVHALEQGLGPRAELTVILEQSPARLALARGRARRLGWWKVSGQMAFVGLVLPFLRRSGRGRVAQIARDHDLDLTPARHDHRVSSVNDDATVALVTHAAPSVVIVHGTRIISRSVLDALAVPVLNVHAGVTPRYRGVHGGYWALREGRRDLAGSTVHLVDPGIDTGGILAQATFSPSDADTIATYPTLQLACALPMLLAEVETILAGSAPHAVPPLPGAEQSELRWHPTAWDYVQARVRQGVR